MTDNYEIRHFSPAQDAAGNADEATSGWLHATSLGFLNAEQTPEHLGRVAATYAENEWTLTGAYTAAATAGAWPVSRPVATYATFDRQLNVGDDRQILAHLIAAVTVRANHRRRGLLRRIIEDDLRTAAAAGIPIAALYAAEATIYGRFGFGPATQTRVARINTDPGFRLDHDATGTVDVADRESLARIAPGVFDDFHAATLGSIERQTFSARKIAGLWGDDMPEPDAAVRAIVHHDADGRLDGYVAYRFRGWDTNPHTISIIDFVAPGRDAWLELWQHLASIDLVTLIETDQAPLDDPLQWAIADPRRYSVVGGEDGVWLRILDVPAALAGRSYDTDGEITITAVDPLGITGGTYRLTVSEGRGDVQPTDGDADVTIDISELSSLYLGGPSAITLARAGRIAGTTEAVARLDRLLQHEIEPVCATHF